MSKNKKKKNALILTSAGIQMAVTIYLGAFFGKMLDKKYPNDKNWFTMGLTILAIAISMYYIITQLKKLNEDED